MLNKHFRNFRNILYCFIVFCCTSFSVTAQSFAYWQQEVNYKINVTLDDHNHELTGNIEIEYINHSPDELTFLWFHLWMNAYKNTNTAFAIQQLENGNTDFFFSKPEEKGWMDGLDFKVNGESVVLIYDSVNIDIAKLILNKPLASGEKITVTTPFHVKLPYTFSRGGHVGRQYQITQWYPKPAVYDRNGWHPMPYLDQGEFYADYGSFDVSITLPADYVVGATGDLQNEAERKWLDEKAAFTKQKFNLSMNEPEKTTASNYTQRDSSMKTIRYTQQRIHDFAWFADKNYNILKGSVTLPQSGRSVTTWLMFTDAEKDMWLQAQPYIDSSLYYYSKWLGDYPYQQATAVQGALKAGAGMEYPNVCIIGMSRTPMILETSIAHEIGHNWLYGILGFNERLHPWMDEGINSYYEQRYLEKRYPGKLFVPVMGVTKFFDIDHYPSRYMKYFTYLFQERRHQDQPADLPATGFSEINYGSIVYAKTALLFFHLASSLGQEEFDSVMQQFYEQWKFKHPQPEDFRKFFENKTRVNLDWLFDQSLTTTQHLDYKISAARDTMQIASSLYRKLTIKNAGGIRAPFPVTAIKNEQPVHTIWYGGFTGKLDILFPEGDYDKFTIDEAGDLWESNRKNNTIRTHGLFRKTEPWRIQLLGSLENPNRNQLFFSPAGGWNNYNGGMAGLAFYNSFLPSRSFEYQLAPMWSFGSNSFAGIGKMAYHFYPKGELFHEIIFTVTQSRFSYDSLKYKGTNYFTDYSRTCGRIDFNFNYDPKSRKRIGLTLRSIFISKEELRFHPDKTSGEFLPTVTPFDHLYNILSFHIENKRVINPYHLSFNIERGDNLSGSYYSYFKLYLEGNYFINYNKAKSGLSVRLFTGAMADISSVSRPEIFHLSATTGSLDYMFDEVYPARSEREGFFSHQFTMQGAEMKFRNDFLLQPLLKSAGVIALNLKSSLPFKSPLFLFLDIGTFSPVQRNYNPVLFDGGIGIALVPNVCEVYVPLLFSDDIKRNINTVPAYDKWYKRILFTLNISNLNPFDKIRNFQL